MQSDRYGHRIHLNAVCIWCEHQFMPAASRARENDIFCTKKCEIEAKFWLLDRIKECPKPEDTNNRGDGI